MTKSKLKNTPNTGVGYYNKENKKNKENKENIYKNEVTSFVDKENICLSGGSGLASLSASQTSVSQDTSATSSSTGSSAALTEDMVKRAVIQLFDNGPKSRQRYKLRIRFNLTDKTNPEFIAAISEDMRNFKRYIPPECYDAVVDWARTLRYQIKTTEGTYPKIGKFHYNNGWSDKTQKGYIQIEPWTFAGVWFDNHHQGWQCYARVYDWGYPLSLTSDYLTEEQKKIGVIAQAVWTNPKYDTRQRPKTWAQRRQEGLK